MPNIENLIILIGIAFIGASVGSFINVIIYRLPKMMNRHWLGECLVFLRDYLEEIIQNQNNDSNIPKKDVETNANQQDLTNTNYQEITQLINKIEDNFLEDTQKPFNLITPRSHCPNCGEKIPFYRNIPIVTWLALKGKALCCSQPISIRYFIIELLAAGLAILGISIFGFNLEGLLAVGFLLTLLALAAIDYQTRLLPDIITIPLIWIGLIVSYYNIFTNIETAVVGAICGYLFLWLLYHGHRIITKRDGMGYGDFKLTAAFGAWFGFKAIPIILFLAALIGLFFALTSSRLRNNPRSEILAFGPALCISAAIYLFFGEQIIYWLKF